MLFYQTIMAIVLAGLAIATPIDEAITLERRANNAILFFSLCDSCRPIATGGCVLTQTPYYHDSSDGQTNSCSDPQTPFNTDFCSTFGTIHTPNGDATWVANPGCSSATTNGAVKGQLNPSGGGYYTCYFKQESYSQGCLGGGCQFQMMCYYFS